MSTRAVGQQAEDRAAVLLQAKGYRLVARNVRTKISELDAVAWDGDTLCFIEVRMTADEAQDGPLATVNRRKQRHIIRGARAYLATMTVEVAVRFDVLGLWQDHGVEKHVLVQGAFVS